MAMPEKASSPSSSQDELEQLSAIEESMASFAMGDLDSEHGVVLKDWSAQDFANIYVRFRPHLMSHARKFLREETQAEEVVQDAFLYLMTALPELDSELGVLRFLKWKTKLLCFDLIRVKERLPENLMSDEIDSLASSGDLSEIIDRASDASIVATALAKLSPRHREAIVSAVLLEEPNSVTAAKMGLTDNGFRQLLYRARRAFRLSLVGEAKTEGKSVSEILSIAFRKAAAEKGVRSGFVLALALVSSIPVGLFGTFSEPGPSFIASNPLPSMAAPVMPLEVDWVPSGSEVSAARDAGHEYGSESEELEVPNPVPVPISNQIQADILESTAIIPEEVIKGGQTAVEMDGYPILEESKNWASMLLTDLGQSTNKGSVLPENLQVVVRIGDSSKLVLTFEEHRPSKLAFAVIEGIGKHDGLVAIPTIMFQSPEDVDIDSREPKQIVLSGFAVSNLAQAAPVPVIESGYFSQIALEIKILTAPTESGEVVQTVEVISLTRS